MRIYLDEDSVSSHLVALLRVARHDVESTSDIGMNGEPDPEQLRHAVREQRVLLSRNDDDFEMLHELVLDSGGHHPGIMIVRYDNDASRDLTPRGIVLAVGKLAGSGVPIHDVFPILNHWR